jgi:hypothetical protein
MQISDKCGGSSGPPVRSPVLLQWLAGISRANSCTKLQTERQMFRIAALQQGFALQYSFLFYCKF